MSAQLNNHHQHQQHTMANEDQMITLLKRVIADSLGCGGTSHEDNVRSSLWRKRVAVDD